MDVNESDFVELVKEDYEGDKNIVRLLQLLEREKRKALQRDRSPLDNKIAFNNLSYIHSSDALSKTSSVQERSSSKRNLKVVTLQGVVHYKVSK